MRYLRGPLLLLAITLIVAVGCAPKQEEPAPAAEEQAPAPEVAMELVATADLHGQEGSTVMGAVTFTESGGQVVVEAHIEGAPAGTHGLHVHEIGDCSAADFTSAGGHFNPTGAPHGGPSDAERHAGDLGNIEISEDGTGHLQLTSELLTVSEGPSSVVGRGVILHEKADDLVSQPTGAAGGRIACGVVSLHGDEMGEEMHETEGGE